MTLLSGARPILDLGFVAVVVGVVMAVMAEWCAVAGALHWDGNQFAVLLLTEAGLFLVLVALFAVTMPGRPS